MTVGVRFDDEETQKHKVPPAPAPKILELVAGAAKGGTIDDLKAVTAPMSFVGPRPPEDDEWSFRTQSLRTLKQEVNGTEVIVDEAFLVHPIKKKAAGPFAGTVLIGRSGSNDISILHSSVSKLHARAAMKGDRVFLSDAGSSNGTVVNGRKLNEGEEVALSSGDLVLFGACHYVALDAESLHAILTKFSKLPQD